MTTHRATSPSALAELRAELQARYDRLGALSRSESSTVRAQRVGRRLELAHVLDALTDIERAEAADTAEPEAAGELAIELIAGAAACPCWTDRELAARGLYCPACSAEIAGHTDPPCSAAGGSWRV